MKQSRARSESPDGRGGPPTSGSGPQAARFANSPTRNAAVHHYVGEEKPVVRDSVYVGPLSTDECMSRHERYTQALSLINIIRQNCPNQFVDMRILVRELYHNVVTFRFATEGDAHTFKDLFYVQGTPVINDSGTRVNASFSHTPLEKERGYFLREVYNILENMDLKPPEGVEPEIERDTRSSSIWVDKKVLCRIVHRNQGNRPQVSLLRHAYSDRVLFLGFQAAVKAIRFE